MATRQRRSQEAREQQHALSPARERVSAATWAQAVSAASHAISGQLAQWRHRLNLSQQQVSEGALELLPLGTSKSVTWSTVNRYEQVDREQVALASFRNLATLAVSLDQLPIELFHVAERAMEPYLPAHLVARHQTLREQVLADFDLLPYERQTEIAAYLNMLVRVGQPGQSRQQALQQALGQLDVWEDQHLQLDTESDSPERQRPAKRGHKRA